MLVLFLDAYSVHAGPTPGHARQSTEYLFILRILILPLWQRYKHSHLITVYGVHSYTYYALPHSFLIDKIAPETNLRVRSMEQQFTLWHNSKCIRLNQSMYPQRAPMLRAFESIWAHPSQSTSLEKLIFHLDDFDLDRREMRNDRFGLGIQQRVCVPTRPPKLSRLFNFNQLTLAKRWPFRDREQHVNR